MSEYIDRVAALAEIRNLYPSAPWLKRNLKWWSQKNKAYIECERAVQSLPAADVAPVKHGRWKWLMITGNYVCSECNCWWKTDGDSPSKEGFRYCPNCGAAMYGDESDG